MNNITIDILDKLIHINKEHLLLIFSYSIESALSKYIHNYYAICSKLILLNLISIEVVDGIGYYTIINENEIQKYKRILKLKNIIYEL